MDQAGFLYFIGRRDNMIKCSGYRVSPTEVEEVLFQSGKLREAGVIGIPDPVLGQAIKAYIVPRDGECVDAEALQSYCAERMPRYMVPKIMQVMKSLPKTPSGKVDYPELRRREEV
jgi:acyl-coenzyme A synthetase/AMP-(fatty) acid ligase